MKPGNLTLGDGHTMYYEEHGNGKPVVVLHGGPGGGLNRDSLQFFNKDKWRIILYDQRGCGKSTPVGSTINNTTWHLVDDIERLRTHLSISTWVVFGGSWGTTLGLAYSETYPASVTGLILRGVCLLNKSEVNWLYKKGASELFPNEWSEFMEPIQHIKNTNHVRAYHTLLTSRDTRIRTNAANHWWNWEASVSHLIPRKDNTSAHTVSSLAILENHYFLHNAWLRPNQLLEQKNIEKIQHIPTIIIQGRYDLVCPVKSAWMLKQALPSAKLRIIPDSGHSALEPSTIVALREATDSFLHTPHTTKKPKTKTRKIKN